MDRDHPVMRADRKNISLIIALLIVAAGLVMALLRSDRPPMSRGESMAPPRPKVEPSPRATTSDEPMRPKSSVTPTSPRVDPPTRPSHPDLPHPITPQHETIFRDNALRESLSIAVDRRDLAAARVVLAQPPAPFTTARPPPPSDAACAENVLRRGDRQPHHRSVRSPPKTAMTTGMVCACLERRVD